MGINFSFPGVALEVIFGLVAVFLFFAPTVLEWDWWSYLGCVFFAGLALATVKLRKG